DHVVIVIDHSGRPARPQGRKPKAEAADFAAAARPSLLLESELDADGCAHYVDEYAAKLGVKVDAEARQALAATEDVAEIKNALDRLSLTLKRIRVGDVHDYAVSPGESKLWE